MEPFSTRMARASENRIVFASYCSLLAANMATDLAKNLFWPTHEQLLKTDPYIVLAVGQPGRGSSYEPPLAGFHAAVDGGSDLHIMGMVTTPALQSRGMMRAFMPRALAKFAKLNPPIQSLSTEVRVYKEGDANIRAEKVFARLGFKPDSEWHLSIEDTPADRHFRESQEEDGIVTARRLRSTDATFALLRWTRA